jgi:hypothetical protein
MKTETRYILMGAVVLVILAVLLAYLPGDNEHTVVALNKLKIATGFILLALIFLFGFAVLVYIANGSIDLSDLLSETGDSKGASMSRFQLLIFTLVSHFGDRVLGYVPGQTWRSRNRDIGNMGWNDHRARRHG